MKTDDRDAVVNHVMTEMRRLTGILVDLPPPPNHAVDTEIKLVLGRASAARLAALAAGATAHSDPAWARAALVETWALAMTGKFGGRLFEHVTRGIAALGANSAV